ncbi:hypothetical protein CDAR_90791 [Caerostris darwini]|uniref:Uncharacterized protein n=1 Tax=Caerostris darwini TaxID=1538125 RepID=A0AAV4QID0_9ARAC|nr:hypothetical protein CDAR_90791 [Caerostris darwini]
MVCPEINFEVFLASLRNSTVGGAFQLAAAKIADGSFAHLLLETDRTNGYTGFCPNLPQQVGVSYAWATYAVLKEDPKLSKRLGSIKPKEKKECNPNVKPHNCSKGPSQGTY